MRANMKSRLKERNSMLTRSNNKINSFCRLFAFNSSPSRWNFIVDLINFAFSTTIVIFAIYLRYEWQIHENTNLISIYNSITVPIRIIILVSTICSRCLCNFTIFHGHKTRSKAICSVSCFIDIATTLPPLIFYIVISSSDSISITIKNHI